MTIINTLTKKTSSSDPTKTSKRLIAKKKKQVEEASKVLNAPQKPTIVKKRVKKKSRYHTGTYVSPKCKKPINFRSGWEQIVCEYFDQDVNVVEYFYEDLIIAYRTRPTQVKAKKYIVDFVVVYADGTKKIIEVKAENKVNHPITLKKTAAAKEWCAKNNVVYEIWTGNKIKEILKEQKQKLLEKSKLKSK